MTTEKQESNFILFDGVCNLCNGFVQFVLTHEKQEFTRFASLQSEAGQVLLAKHKIDPEKIDSIVFINGNKASIKSRAVLGILKYLKFPWYIFSIFKVLPASLSDLIYDWIARHRYRLFGKRESCWVPSPDLIKRFVEDSDQIS